MSSDFVGSRAACVFDAKATIVNGNQAVLYLWYDNEYGYSCSCTAYWSEWLVFDTKPIPQIALIHCEFGRLSRVGLGEPSRIEYATEESPTAGLGSPRSARCAPPSGECPDCDSVSAAKNFDSWRGVGTDVLGVKAATQKSVDMIKIKRVWISPWRARRLRSWIRH